MKKNYTPKEYGDLAWTYFFISGFLLIGYAIAFFLLDGLDNSIFYSLPLFFFALFTGFRFRKKSKQ